MPRGVKIGLTVLLTISALVLIWSLYYNWILVTGGWAVALRADVVGEGPAARVEYRLTVLQQDGTRRDYRLPYADVAGLQPGDKIHLRRRGEGSARRVRSRRPHLAELVILADRIFEIRIAERSSPADSEQTVAGRVLHVWKPAGGRPPDGDIRIPLRLAWLPQGDAPMQLALRPGDRVLVFLDERGRLFAGASGVIRLQGENVPTTDVELSLRLPEAALKEDLTKMLAEPGRFAR